MQNAAQNAVKFSSNRNLKPHTCTQKIGDNSYECIMLHSQTDGLQQASAIGYIMKIHFSESGIFKGSVFHSIWPQWLKAESSLVLAATLETERRAAVQQGSCAAGHTVARMGKEFFNPTLLTLTVAFLLYDMSLNLK